MAKPVSISAREISAAAKGSVAKVLENHKPAFPMNDVRIGYFPPHWILGFILDSKQLEKSTLEDAQALANNVHRGIAGSVASVAAGKPALILGGGHIICGFLPPPDINLIEE